MNQYAQETFGQPCARVKLRVKAIKGGASGGTIASMMTAVEAGRADREMARTLKNPYGLNPTGQTSGPDQADLQGAAFDDDLDVWIAPFVMATINTKIVRRSNALMNYAYGKDFRYDEAVIVGKGLGGRMKATGTALGLGGFMLASAFDFSRKLLVKRLPKPGEGPNAAQREKGFFNLILVGKLTDGTVFRGKVTGDRDPGYGSTSKMLGESAVCLAKDLGESVAGGLLTPASAMAEPLLARMVNNAGLTFEIVDAGRVET